MFFIVNYLIDVNTRPSSTSSFAKPGTAEQKLSAFCEEVISKVSENPQTKVQRDLEHANFKRKLEENTQKVREIADKLTKKQ